MDTPDIQSEVSRADVPPSGSARHIVVWLTNERDGLPHIGRFLKRNPGVAVHVVNGARVDGSERKQMWRNCDRMIREWWVTTGYQLDFDRAIFLEWDVVFEAPIEDIFPEGHFVSRNVHKPENSTWTWFSEIKLLPPELREHATGVSPLAALAISRKCLSDIMSHPLADKAFADNIFCELRLPTLAAACGYTLTKNRHLTPHLEWYPVKAKAGEGVWHAVKA